MIGNRVSARDGSAQSTGGGQDPSESGKDCAWQVAGCLILPEGLRGRTCLEQAYTLIQNEVKRTLREGHHTGTRKRNTNVSFGSFSACRNSII